jgi:hypothetical protein
MILFVLKIFDYIQNQNIKFIFLSFSFYKYIKKTTKHTHPFLLCFSHTSTCNYK